ncbi:AAA family ATPase [Patescibacteria group bacterium]|nr:AAA family ATPase [Patescibacteria group bacterium]
MSTLVIGLTGPMGCGKGEVVKLLEKEGFEYITLSMMVREEARRRGIEEEREKLMEVGNSMRSAEGAGVLAARALRKIMESGHDNWVVDGIRNPAEIEELKTIKNAHVVGISANEDILVERVLGRGRESDAKDRDEILRKLRREWGVGEPEDGQQLEKCMERADVIIPNEGTLEELHKKFIEYYNFLRSKGGLDERPTKNNYYMDMAKSVARRATCLKVEIGAVIIRDDQVVATGYCGAPRGTKSSLEHGFCLRQKLGIPSGQRYEMCRSVHAEQNAIINAARSGTSVLGGDMYIYGELKGENKGQVLDAFPCFICKKMVINCGIKKVICSLKDGGMKVFEVEDWIKDWSERDIIDDEHQYGVATAPKIERFGKGE